MPTKNIILMNSKIFSAATSSEVASLRNRVLNAGVDPHQLCVQLRVPPG